MTPSEKNLFHEISIHYQPQLVQIVCDQNLKDYLREKRQRFRCGETEVDSNRWIWDKLAPYKSIIYGALGDRA